MWLSLKSGKLEVKRDEKREHLFSFIGFIYLLELCICTALLNTKIKFKKGQ